jgi:hypothetical protein
VESETKTSSWVSYPPQLRLRPGQDLGGRYKVERFLGSGWEGEVYKVIELVTQLPRAAKFYLSRGERSAREVQQAMQNHARKLAKLRGCSMVLQYHHAEVLQIRNQKVHAMISEYSPGLPLDMWLGQRPQPRMELFEAMTLLHAISRGLAAIHGRGEYHGDLHAGNVLVRQRGIQFEIKILDFFHHGRERVRPRRQDVVDAVHLFYDLLGGAEVYASLPAEAKFIVRGLKPSLIRQRFPSAASLCRHLESFTWKR